MSDETKRRLMMVEIPRDELALRIAQPCLGMIAPAGTDATKALDDMDRVPGAAVPMGQSFRLAADAAVAYFHECISKGQRPS